jgi:hypothetical protein
MWLGKNNFDGIVARTIFNPEQQQGSTVVEPKSFLIAPYICSMILFIILVLLSFLRRIHSSNLKLLHLFSLRIQL